MKSNDTSSRIFLGNHVLGYVSTHVPLVARYIKRRDEHLFVTSIGRWFHTYGCNNFRLLSVSGEHPAPITCMTGDNFHVYTASENKIYAWRRGCELKHVYEGHLHPIHSLMAFGPHLISVDEKSVLKVWDIKEGIQYLEILFDCEVFSITTLTHPPTYMNKVLLGSEQGQLQLWNIRTSKLVFSFKGWLSPVTVVEPAPAIDVVAIAIASGKIFLHNLKVDETLMEFTHDWGVVTSLSFRLDGQPIMVTGSSDGHIVLWDLEERRVASQLEAAHHSAVVGLQCLMSQPLMVSNSGDNSLKLWIFDMPDGGARLLRIREGHSSPPTVILHCEPTGNNILSAASDSSLHIMNTLTETFNKNLGKASYCRKISKKKKRLQEDNLIMPAIVGISSCMQRDKQWDSIATIHSNSYIVTTWSYNNLKMGKHKMKPISKDKSVYATCLTVTHCGNFVIVGYSNGVVNKFNMQSGIHRGAYGESHPAHAGAVRGVVTDVYNQRVLSVGADKHLKFWHFKNMKMAFNVLGLEESVSGVVCDRESGLVVLCNEDYSLTLLDMDTMAIVRKLEGHTGRINDVSFDAQSRWLITSSMDCTICTWDIPSGQLIDIFMVEHPCTSLSMSPTGNLLATTHVGQLGIFLWANKALYTRTYLKPIDRNTTVIPKLELPNAVTEKHELDDLNALDVGDEEYQSPEQISDELITLSNLPACRWINLLNLDIVKKRNKPKMPVTVPKTAPFFLPTTPSLEIQFDMSNEQNRFSAGKLIISESLLNLTLFGKLLNEGDINECITKLKTFPSSKIEMEVVNLAPEAGGSTQLMRQFLIIIEYILKGNQNFELGQAYLSLFLKTHTKVIAQNAGFEVIIEVIEKTQEAGWKKLQDMLFYNICIIKSLKNMQINNT